MSQTRVRRNLFFAAGFSLLAFVLGALGYAAYSWHTRQFERRNLDLFHSLLPIESLRLRHWQAERSADLAHYVMSPAARRALAGLDAGRPAPEAAARASAWFGTALRAHPSYRRVDVLTRAGTVVWSTAGVAPDAPPRPVSHVWPPEGAVTFTPLTVEDGVAVVYALARSGPLAASVRIDVTVDPVPSLGNTVPLETGAFDFYLARRAATDVEVVDHDLKRNGAVRTYRLPLDSAAGRALAAGAMAQGPDHFGRTVLAMPAPDAWLGWRPLAAREVGTAHADSRWLAFVFVVLGALAVGGAFFLLSRLMRSAESEGAAAAERLELLTRLHEAMRVCSAASRLARSRRELAAEICRALADTGAFKTTVFWEPAPGDRLVPYADGGLRPGTALPASVPARPSSAEEETCASRAFVTGAVVVVDDFDATEGLALCRAFGLAQGVRSAMAVPLADGCAGDVLVVASSETAFFNGEARALVATIAAYFTAACEGFAAAERSLRVDAELAKNKRLLEQVAIALPLGIFILDTKTRETVFTTPALAAILDAPPDSAHRFGPSFILERIHPDDASNYSGFLDALAKAEDDEVVESASRVKSRQSDWKHVRVRGVVFERAATGEPTLVLGTLEDVTDAAKAAEALEQSWQDYRRVLQAVECAAESIIITDAKGNIQYVNPAFSRVTGYTKEESVGRHTRELKSGVHPPEFYKDLWGAISSGRTWTGRLVNKAKDGSFFEEDASIAPVKDEHGAVTNFVAVKKDVTKELSLESQLQQSQKLEAVGRLAGGVAHDFNNILTAILGYAHLALSALPEGSPVREDLAEIDKGARRAAELTRQLLIFSRKQVIKPQVLDPASVALGLQKMLRRIVGEDIHLRFASDGGVRILADPGQFEQVVLNFVVNARDAMPGGGEVEVAVREAVLAVPAPGVEGPIPPGAYAVLSVRDAGTGIPPDVLPRIFEPFYTTKPAGEGTGLGLSTVYGIVKQGGAYLRVESTPGAGTLMSVFWPALKASAPPVEAPGARPARGGAESILLVEDEPSVLHLTERLLRDAGYRVSSFADAASASSWARSGGARYDLLLTDVILPGGTDGKALAQSLKDGRPGLKVLYTSGYSADAVSHHGVLDAGTRLLAKPFSEEGLLAAVRDALDAA